MNTQVMNHDVHSPIFIRAKSTNAIILRVPTLKTLYISSSRNLFIQKLLYTPLIHLCE